MLKTYVLTTAKTFLKGHPKAGTPTNFKNKILSDPPEKIHTIRANYQYWARIIKEVNDGRAMLSIREWKDKPYCSPQVEYKQIHKAAIEPIAIMGTNNLVWLNDHYLTDYEIEKLANNDGLSKTDFEDWFCSDIVAGIIHFTDYRYIKTETEMRPFMVAI